MELQFVPRSIPPVTLSNALLVPSIPSTDYDPLRPFTWSFHVKPSRFSHHVTPANAMLIFFVTWLIICTTLPYPTRIIIGFWFWRHVFSNCITLSLHRPPCYVPVFEPSHILYPYICGQTTKRNEAENETSEHGLFESITKPVSLWITRSVAFTTGQYTRSLPKLFGRKRSDNILR